MSGWSAEVILAFVGRVIVAAGGGEGGGGAARGVVEPSRGSGIPGWRSEDTAPSVGDDVPEAIALGKVLGRETGGDRSQPGRDLDVKAAGGIAPVVVCRTPNLEDMVPSSIVQSIWFRGLVPVEKR